MTDLVDEIGLLAERGRRRMAARLAWRWASLYRPDQLRVPAA